MWIVRIALQRPYTFLMLAALIVLMGLFAIVNTPTQVLSLGDEYTNPWGICGVWWRNCSGRGMTDAAFVAHLYETGCEQVIPVERA